MVIIKLVVVLMLTFTSTSLLADNQIPEKICTLSKHGNLICKFAVITKGQVHVAENNLFQELELNYLEINPIKIDNSKCSYERAKSALKDSSGNTILQNGLTVAESVYEKLSDYNAYSITLSNSILSIAYPIGRFKIIRFKTYEDFWKSYSKFSNFDSKPWLFKGRFVKNMYSGRKTTDSSCFIDQIY